MYIEKTEQEFDIDKKNLPDFLTITNDIVCSIKNTNNEIIKTNKDLKKLLDNKSEVNTRKFTKKKITHIENANQLKNKLAKKGVRDGKNMSNKSKGGIEIDDNNQNLRMRMNKNIHSSELYKINFNKITNLEAQPGKINVKERVEKEFSTTGMLRVENSTMNQITTESKYS